MNAGEREPSGAHDAYRAAGVDYELLDSGKRLALARALETSPLLSLRGGRALDDSRGASAFVFEFAGRELAIVVEGLGTKSMIARQVLEQTGVNRFGDVAYDTVAAIVNDLCSVGALPLVVNAYFATGASEWYDDPARVSALLEGWASACADASCTWGGGESPSLAGLVAPAEVELAGSAVGALPEGTAALLGDALAPGDEIVLVASSGLHANGASLARATAARLPDGYRTPLPGGGSFGEALLVPSLIYVPLVERLLERRVPVTYLSHITGHGLMKIMRPPRPLTYRLRELPPVPPVLELLAEASGMDAKAAHATLNMGSGYAVYCRAGHGERVVSLAHEVGHDALVAGAVEEGPRRVVVEPYGFAYTDEELALSPE